MKLPFSSYVFRELRWRLGGPSYVRRWLERKLALSNSQWLFVLGVNNSGTTVISHLLAAHPEISSLAGEGQFLSSVFPRAYQYGISRIWSEREDLFRWTEDDDPSPALRAVYDWSYYLSPGRYLMEKSPPNVLRSRWLQRNFGRCCFIALVRAPYAVAEGIRRREGYSIARAARHWALANEILLDDMAHLERCILVRYEDFCERPMEQLRRIREFLGLEVDWDESAVATTFGIHSIDGRERRLENLNEKSIARLSTDDLEIITSIAGPLMSRLGYDVQRSPEGTNQYKPSTRATS